MCIYSLKLQVFQRREIRKGVFAEKTIFIMICCFKILLYPSCTSIQSLKSCSKSAKKSIIFFWRTNGYP